MAALAVRRPACDQPGGLGRAVIAVAVALLVMACLMGGALPGLVLQSVLPGHHLDSDSKDVARLASGVTASVAALERSTRRLGAWGRWVG